MPHFSGTLPPNFAIVGDIIEEALLISMHLSTEITPNKSHRVSTLGKKKVCKYFQYSVCESSTALNHTCRHATHLP